jgi:hypothetical protein
MKALRSSRSESGSTLVERRGCQAMIIEQTTDRPRPMISRSRKFQWPNSEKLWRMDCRIRRRRRAGGSMGAFSFSGMTCSAAINGSSMVMSRSMRAPGCLRS